MVCLCFQFSLKRATCWVLDWFVCVHECALRIYAKNSNQMLHLSPLIVYIFVSPSKPLILSIIVFLYRIYNVCQIDRLNEFIGCGKRSVWNHRFWAHKIRQINANATHIVCVSLCLFFVVVFCFASICQSFLLHPLLSYSFDSVGISMMIIKHVTNTANILCIALSDHFT